MSQADIIRGLGLPNTAAGQAVARALVETDELDNPLGYLSTEELGPNGANLDRIIAAAPRPEREQIYSRLVSGLATPVRVGNRTMTISTPPGGAEILRGRLAEARGEAPRPAPVAPGSQVAPGGNDWIGPTMGWSLRNETERRTDLNVGTAMTVGGVTSTALGGAVAWGGAAIIGATAAPIVAGVLIVGGIAAAGYGAYRLLKAVSIF